MNMMPKELNEDYYGYFIKVPEEVVKHKSNMY